MEINEILKKPLVNIPNLDEAYNISKKYKVALHPAHLFYWNELSVSRFIDILEYFKRMDIDDNLKESSLPFPKKKSIEELGIEHTIKIPSLADVKSEEESKLLLFDEITTKTLLLNLGYDYTNYSNKTFVEHIQKLIELSSENLSKKTCEIINIISEIEIRDKGGSYIGARMGRPEKAKMRKLDGKPHGLFPVGDEGGRLKNIMEAYQKKGYITSNFAIFRNKQTGEESIYRNDSGNEERNEELYFEKYTETETDKKSEKAVRYKKTRVDIKKYLENVRDILGVVELPKLVKGIKETSNKHRKVEHISKAFIRALNNVYVNKDGTIRFDMIEMGLTHFRPKEIGTSIEKLKELGYTEDVNGDELVNGEQLVEIFPQDVILPDCKESGDELASEFVINTSKFIDDMLEKLYKLPRFYNFKKKEDTIGHLIIGLAPHTSAGIVGRIIGYSRTQGCFSHPVWHAAQRRNLDGDENGIILLLDALINFSRDFLPDRRGSRTMDTSLVLTSHLYLDQIDDEVHGMDIVDHYPLELYRAAKEFKSPKEIKIEKVEKRIKKKKVDDQYLGYKFTHDNNDLNNTIMCSSYKSLPSMAEKMDMQLRIGEKIRAVDENQVGSFIIDKHFMKDIKGNLRKFSMQSFRCTKCNTIFRRPPLIGKCTECGEASVNFTISEGSIKKYLTPSFNIIKKYDVDPYIVETLELVNLRIEGVFGKETEKQKSITDFW